MLIGKIKRALIGEPLSNAASAHERIPKWKGLSTLSSDALSSVAYATDEVLLVLVAVSMAAAAWSIPVALGIVILLIIVTASYWQTITAYPNGGGAYTVARENLGEKAGLTAGAALLLDYTLTVAVSVSAGVENIASAFPSLVAHKVLLGVIVIGVIMFMNLRGLRESATIFAFPTYFFILSIIVLLSTAAWKAYVTNEIPAPAPILTETYPTIALVVFLRAFASGCAALTGIEAISNGVPIFRDPASKNAKITLVWMSIILGSFFLMVTAMVHVYGIVPQENQTIVSQLGKAVFGNSFIFYAIQFATMSILFLAANTAYADFPRLASLLARDRYLPRQLGSLGDRLVFSNGILWLSLSSAFLIFMFGGKTHALVPLYAVGVFLSFTLSQSGMVVHHLREKQKGYVKSLILNALGALTTFVVLADIAFTKFIHGAWAIVLAIPILMWVFLRVKSHYLSVGRELNLAGQDPKHVEDRVKHTVVMPISGIHRGVVEALRYAKSISDDVRACYVEIDPESTDRIKAEWHKWAPGVPFVVLKSPYRSVIEPLINYVDDVESGCNDELVTIVVPEFVTSKWWHSLLHNQTAFFIRAAFMFKKGKVVTSVRYHLNSD
jgi:amino acid transporter